MRALVISTAVVGAMVLTGCQSTGNNLGGMEYDKTALGTVIGAAAGYGVSKICKLCQLCRGFFRNCHRQTLITCGSQ